MNSAVFSRSAGLAGKKLFARAWAFSVLIVAITSILPCLCFRAGMQALAPSVEGWEVYL